MLGLTTEILLGFALTSAVIELTPGPNMAYLAVLAATDGRRHGYAAVAGVALGLLIVGMLAGFGLAAIIAASPVLFQALRWGGVVYLLWLAWDSWGEEKPEENEFAASDAKFFKRGLIVNLLNPKAGVFYIAILPQFVTAQEAVLAQTLSLSVLYVAIATGIHATIVTLAGYAHALLDNADRRRVVRRVMAVALVVIAAWFAWSTA